MKFFKSNIKLVFYINNKNLMHFLFFSFLFSIPFSYTLPVSSNWAYKSNQNVPQFKLKLNLKHFFIIEEKNVIKVCRS